MFKFILLSAFVGAAYSQANQDSCEEDVRTCGRPFSNSKREPEDWRTALECVRRASGLCLLKENTINWMDGEIKKAEEGYIFSPCDHSVTQCHLDFMMSDMGMAYAGMAYMPCLNSITPGCKSQSDTLYWVNEEVKRSQGKEENEPWCVTQVNQCKDTYYLNNSTRTVMNEDLWRSFNACVVVVEPKCLTQSEMIWMINEESRKMSGSDPGCDMEINRCLMGYSPQQNSDAWYGQRTCVEKIDMPCQKKSDTLWWINDELRKLMETAEANDRIDEGRNDKDNDESNDKDDDKWDDKDGDNKETCFTCDCHVSKCGNTFYMSRQEMRNWYDYRSCLEMINDPCTVRMETLRQVNDAIWAAESNGGMTDGTRTSGSPRVAQMPVLMFVTAVLAWTLV